MASSEPSHRSTTSDDVPDTCRSASFPVFLPPIPEGPLESFQIGIGLDFRHPRVMSAGCPLADDALRNAVLAHADILGEFPRELTSVDDPSGRQMTEVGDERLRAEHVAGLGLDIEKDQPLGVVGPVEP